MTFHETVGSRGMMAGKPESHTLFFPVYHVLAAIAPFSGGMALSAVSSSPLEIEALAMSAGRKSELWRPT